MATFCRNFKVGDRVKLHPVGALARERHDKMHLIGTVVAADHITGWGDGVKVQWPEEDAPAAYQGAGFFDPA